jgi:pyrroline-5-carboxylate reductase
LFAYRSPVVRTLLSSIGKLEHVPEDQMDAACATGGAGLAFAFYFIAAMIEGGVKVGLGRSV